MWLIGSYGCVCMCENVCWNVALASDYESILCIMLDSLSSDRQHLSYDGCLEVRLEIIRTVLFCIVY